jgi:hypothetical protein
LATEPVTFGRDVMAVLSKAGCNQGTCHGNQNGKNGFKLSLRGQNPAGDFDILLREQFGRRVNPQEPEQSLLVLKAVAAVPHGGGRRFRTEAPEYDILCRWIADGVPADPTDLPRLVKLEASPREEFVVAPAAKVQVRVKATFADGSTRDVTRWAVYTPSNPIVSIDESGSVERERDGETTLVVRYLNRQATVRLAFVPERPGYQWRNTPASNFIDEHVLARLRRLRMDPSDLCSDAVFVRRAYLDLLGMLPAADEARAFVADAAADKRSRLIDTLLDRPEFADFWAQKWADLLRVEERTLDRKGVQVFYHWLRQAVADDKPLNELAHELLAARGSTYRNPPANFYRAMRDPITRAESIGQVFLGVRLQCAKCHNHPFDRWTQDDYNGWTEVFRRVDYKVLENRRRDKNDKHEFDGEQIVLVNANQETSAEFLGAGRGPHVGDDPLLAVADWIADATNPYFARAQANRVWFHLMGRGIVDPIDDFRATNPASHPELLDALARDFAASGYRAKPLIRRIMQSRTYQLATATNDTNAGDETNYSHALLRSLSAEQLLDALHQVTGTRAKFLGYPAGVRAGELPGVRIGRSRDGSGMEEQFLSQFGKPPRLLSCECERSTEPTLGQTFQLISGQALNDLLQRGDNRLGALLGSGASPTEIVDQLYWTALGRAPSGEESSAMTRYLAEARDRRAALEDVTWSLVNAKEFVLRQ